MKSLRRHMVPVVLALLLNLAALAQQALPSLQSGIQSGAVTADFTGTGGSSGDSVKVRVAKGPKATPGPHHYDVPPGSQLASSDAAAQSMTILGVAGLATGENTYRPTSVITVPSVGSAVYLLQAFCSEFHKENPSPYTHFTLGEPDPVMACIARHGRNLSVPAYQAAVWMYTDNASFSEVNQKFAVTPEEWSSGEAVFRRCRSGVRSGADSMWNPFRRDQPVPTVLDTALQESSFALPDEGHVFGIGRSLRGTVTGNHWEVVKVLGSGGMGSVFLVKDEAGRHYALKTFNRDLLHDPKKWHFLEEEAATWIRLEHHPNIASALWCERIEDILCILLEYVPGGNVKQRLSSGPLTSAVGLSYGLAICDAMTYAYNKLKLVHRDIKPENCLVDQLGGVKLSDFGIAWRHDANRPTQGARRAGTPGYRPPEQEDDGALLDPRADVYAFAATLFEMLTAVDIQHLHGSAQKLMLFQHVGSNRELRKISPELRDLLVQCLQLDPRDRPPGFPQIRASLGTIYRKVVTNRLPSIPVVKPLRIDELQNKGIALQVLRLYGLALDCYEQALRLSPQDFELLLAKSAVLHLLDRNDAAIEIADRALKLEPTCGDLWNNRGMALLATNRLEEALASFSAALKCDSQDPVFWRNKGLALYRLGRLAEALEAYDSGLSCYHRDPRLYQYKAQALVESGKGEEAVRFLNEGIEMFPHHAGLHHGLGVAFHRLGLFNQSVQSLNRALDLLPDDLEVLRSKVLVLIDSQDWTRALACIDYALAITKTDYELLKNRALALWRLARQDDSIQLLRNLRLRTNGDERWRMELQYLVEELGIPEEKLGGGAIERPLRFSAGTS